MIAGLNDHQVDQLAMASRSVQPHQWQELPEHERAIERLKARDVLQSLLDQGFVIIRRERR